MFVREQKLKHGDNHISIHFLLRNLYTDLNPDSEQSSSSNNNSHFQSSLEVITCRFDYEVRTPIGRSVNKSRIRSKAGPLASQQLISRDHTSEYASSAYSRI